MDPRPRISGVPFGEPLEVSAFWIARRSVDIQRSTRTAGEAATHDLTRFYRGAKTEQVFGFTRRRIALSH